MKPKFNFSPGSQHPRGEKRIPRHPMNGRNQARKFASSVTAISLVAFTAHHASAAVVATTYTTVPSATQLDWNTSTNWTPVAPGTGIAYPGAAAALPEDTTDDTALVTGAFGGVAQTVDISAPFAFPLASLTMGDTSGTGTTTIQTTNASSLSLKSGASITSQGPLVAPANVNLISAPLTLNGGVTLAAVPTPVLPEVATTSNTDLTISGKISPGAAGNRTINNSSGKTVTLGDVDISTGDTTSILTFRNENTFATNRINLHGVIANGSSVAAGLIFEGRINNTVFEIGNNSVQNTYTGTTVLQGNNGGGRPAIFLINSAQPFGPSTAGRLTLGGASNSTAVLEAINADRTIPNENVTMQRNSTFQGSNSLTFSGTIITGSSHNMTNNMSGAAQLIFDGRYNLDNSGNTTILPISGTSDSRMRTFAGTGVTVFNGILADHANPTADMFGGINVTDAGTVVINGAATYQGNTRITGSGTIQLGTGGTTGTLSPDFPNLSYDDYAIIAGAPTLSDPLTFPDFLKKPVVTGGTTGTGTFAVKHSDDIPLSQTLNGGIGLKHIGSGVLTVATPQFNTGANQVGDGISPSKLVVTAAASAETTQTGDFGAPAVHGSGYNSFYQIVENLEDTSLLTIGQPVYRTTPGAAFYIHSIDNATQVTLLGTGITNAGSGLIPGQNVSGPVSDETLKFGAGSSLGTSAATTTVKALSTLTGTGAISGSVIIEGILEPGMSIGTLSTGPLRFNSGSTLKVEINTTDLTSDKVVVTGNVTAGGSPILDLTDLGADVALPDGTKFVLIDYSGTYASAGVVTFAGNPVPHKSSITLGANTYHVNYADATEGGTALTITVGPPPVPVTPFEIWIESFTNQLPVFAFGPSDDPDSDGRDNLLEYALNGNPGDGSNNGKMVISTDDSGDVGTDRDLSITMAVLSGASLGAGPNGSATLTVGGFVYTIQGSEDLQTWNKTINQVTPASTLVPAPDAGWDTYTFQVDDSNGLPEKRFIRVGVE